MISIRSQRMSLMHLIKWLNLGNNKVKWCLFYQKFLSMVLASSVTLVLLMPLGYSHSIDWKWSGGKPLSASPVPFIRPLTRGGRCLCSVCRLVSQLKRYQGVPDHSVATSCVFVLGRKQNIRKRGSQGVIVRTTLGLRCCLCHWMSKPQQVHAVFFNWRIVCFTCCVSFCCE